MDNSTDTQIIEDSLKHDDLLNRLEKLSVFLDNLVNQITEDDVPEEDVSKIVDHIKLQKKIYEQAHELYDSVKEEVYDKEIADKNLNNLKSSIEEYKKYKAE
ncbi:uncharacterized protein VNE69_07063 [Vairimorpha necatrix]|uniref:Uncharacterized protein n=1 Tax=Vairimorpha necatrix TaxID=6039 RepID=A0AAX4JDA5_9MICR